MKKIRKIKFSGYLETDIPIGVPLVWSKRNHRIGFRIASKKWLENYLINLSIT